MKSLRVLLTNNGLAYRAGSELYIRDVALGLVKRGHMPIAYSMELGAIAEELRAHTVPVVDRLDQIAEPPDLIHGQHHYETITALLHFAGVPAVSFCHGWTPWPEAPVAHPRIFRHIAVDDTCRERLVSEGGIPPERVQVMLNFVDLERFRPRPPLPAMAKRALVFGNTVGDLSGLGVLRAACEARGISLDAVGLAVGKPIACPEEVVGNYDLVFAKARCALEAMAAGCAVIVCDAPGVAGLVTTANFERLRRLNFGIRTLQEPLRQDIIEREIDRYDCANASAVSERLRAVGGLDEALEALICLYGEVLEEARESVPSPQSELRAAAAYLRDWGSRFKTWPAAAQLPELEKSIHVLQIETAEKDETLMRLRSEAAALRERLSESEGKAERLHAQISALESQLDENAATGGRSGEKISGLQHTSANNPGFEPGELRPERKRAWRFGRLMGRRGASKGRP